MKIIFLDVDGVLNSIESMLVFGTYYTFNPVNVGLVKRLADQGGANIVVSSSWRTGDVLNTAKLLRESGAGDLVPYIIGETRHLANGHRGSEIKAWMDDNAKRLLVQEYVILDDDSDMLPDQPFVKTHISHGFGLKEYVEALAFLKPDHFDLSDRGISKIVRTASRLSYE